MEETEALVSVAMANYFLIVILFCLAFFLTCFSLQLPSGQVPEETTCLHQNTTLHLYGVLCLRLWCFVRYLKPVLGPKNVWKQSNETVLLPFCVWYLVKGYTQVYVTF